MLLGWEHIHSPVSTRSSDFGDVDILSQHFNALRKCSQPEGLGVRTFGLVENILEFLMAYNGIIIKWPNKIIIKS